MTDGEVWIIDLTPEKVMAFRSELRSLLNVHNMDSYTGTPDFLLAEMIMNQLEAYRRIRFKVGRWEGRPMRYLTPTDE